MGICESRTKEVYTGHKPVPINITLKALKSICKIIIKSKKRNLLWNWIFYEYF